MSTLFFIVPAVLAAVLLFLRTPREDRAEMTLWFTCTWGTGMVLLFLAYVLGWWSP